MPTIHDALLLARQGWRLLPLRGKIPVTRHGVKDASADPAQVAEWWANGANWNIGARVPGHLVVLDIDPRNGGSLEALAAANGGELSDTLAAWSGRGDGGQHRYYRHPGGRLTQRNLPPGTDVKTESGYCVLPPSIHPDTGHPYRWGDMLEPAPFPPGLLTLVRPSEPQRVAPSYAPTNSGDNADRLARRAAHLVQHVAAAGEGQRNGRLYWAVCEAHRCGYPPATFEQLVHAAAHAGLSEHEAAATAASAHRTMGGAR